MDEEIFFEPEDGDEPTREELAVWLSEFMSSAAEAETMYRSNLCNLIVNRVFNEFGYEGLCQMMIAIDKRGAWISDILIDTNDLDDILFSKFGTFDEDAIRKARNSNAMAEMNQKIWRMRRKYAKLIVDEVMGASPTTPSAN
jgi:hypothetical protein